MRRFGPRRPTASLLIGLLIVAGGTGAAFATGAGPDSRPMEITVLYDNYKLCESCTTDWGFSCVIAGTEKTILFDAGTYGNVLLGNMDTLHVDAHDVDLMVISHNHGDHTGSWQSAGGALSFLARNSDVLLYLPPSVPAGPIQAIRATGADALTVRESMEICDRVHLTGPMTGTAMEQSLVLDTPRGLVVVTGCAHQGVVQVVRKAKEMLNKDVFLVLGGFHLLDLSESQIRAIIQQFRALGVQKVGPSHCTGDLAIALFEQAYGCDFNDDWKVDITDLVILIENWGKEAPSVDIAPPLFGDGTVDVQDLEALMQYWDQELPDPSLLAHWRLDEAQGTVAHDRAGGHDATVMGTPLWQPDAGRLGGALQFSGMPNFATAQAVRDPSEGPLSVFAWIKGGAPGQVIVSQAGGANWLMADTAAGALMTELKSASRFSGPLRSGAVVTDGDWHRVGFAWDSARRRLYVDDVLVAEDTDVGLAGGTGGLNIGCGPTMAPGTFFIGLIDDVRVYNRAVTP